MCASCASSPDGFRRIAEQRANRGDKDAAPGDKALGRAGWSKRVFAWMLARGNKKYERAVAARKRSLLGDLAGTVVEVGPGAGVNLAYYPSGIRWIGMEPNPFLHP